MRSGGRYGFRPSSQGRRRVGASEAPCSRQSAAPPFRAAQEIGLWRHLKGRSHAHWAAATRDARGSYDVRSRGLPPEQPSNDGAEVLPGARAANVTCPVISPECADVLLRRPRRAVEVMAR
jgi:hypothetical protein